MPADTDDTSLVGRPLDQTEELLFRQIHPSLLLEGVISSATFFAHGGRSRKAVGRPIIPDDGEGGL
jgi:hypothetical protein